MTRLISLMLLLLTLSGCRFFLEEQPIGVTTPEPSPVVLIVTATPTSTPPPAATSIPPTAVSVPTGSNPTAVPQAPTIAHFTTTATSVRSDRLSARTELVMLTWDVRNRPANSNLVFEQVMPSGTALNIELPRDIPTVSSQGSGNVKPYAPDAGITQIVIRVRLVNLSNQATLTSAQITLPIVEPQISVVTGAACYGETFGGNMSVNVDETWAVLVSSLPVFTTERSSVVVGMLNAEDNTKILEGPFCYMVDGKGFRRWKVDVEKNDWIGWVEEYYLDTTVDTFYPNIKNVFTIISFEVQPRTVKNGDTITVKWQVSGTNEIMPFMCHVLQRFACGGISTEMLPASGSFDVVAPDYVREITFSLRYGMLDGSEIKVAVECRDPWFTNPANFSMCPQAPQTLNAAYQSFERGWMLWFGNQIYVFYSGGNGAIRPDAWTGQPLDYSAVGTPPSGLYAPERGFGYLWLNNTDIRNGLGWATNPEQGYTTTFQITIYGPGLGPNRNAYVTLPDGRAIPMTAVGGTDFKWQTPQ